MTDHAKRLKLINTILERARKGDKGDPPTTIIWSFSVGSGDMNSSPNDCQGVDTYERVLDNNNRDLPVSTERHGQRQKPIDSTTRDCQMECARALAIAGGYRPRFTRLWRNAQRDHPGNKRQNQHQYPVLRSEEHTSELQSPCNLVCRHLLEQQ